MLHSRHRRAIASLALVAGTSEIVLAQTGGFVAGTRELVAIDFKSTAIGQFPDELKLLGQNGAADVVDKNGMHMLRASKPTDILVSLKENLPEAFTIEFDLVPKT